MKKFLAGVIITTILFSAYCHRQTILGPVKPHRQDGVLAVDSNNPNIFYGIDPKTRQYIRKNFNIYRSPTYYFDRLDGESQFVTWQSDNIFDYNVVYHLWTDYPSDFVRDFGLQCFWFFLIGAGLICLFGFMGLLIIIRIIKEGPA